MNDGPVTITVSLWRDFMPGSDDALIVAVTVAAAGAGVLPPGLRAEFQAFARGGPRWPTEASVDVIVELIGPDGVARLRAPDQRIMGVS